MKKRFEYHHSIVLIQSSPIQNLKWLESTYSVTLADALEEIMHRTAASSEGLKKEKLNVKYHDIDDIEKSKKEKAILAT